MRTSFATFASSLLLAGCGPMSGVYTFTVASEESDCPDSYDPGTDPEGDQTITVSQADSTITLAGEPDEVCPLDGMAFVCDFADVDETVDYADQGLQAAYTIDVQMQGEWAEASSMTGLTDVQTRCEGDDCDQVEAAGAPACTMTWYWDATIGS